MVMNSLKCTFQSKGKSVSEIFTYEERITSYISIETSKRIKRFQCNSYVEQHVIHLRKERKQTAKIFHLEYTVQCILYGDSVGSASLLSCQILKDPIHNFASLGKSNLIYNNYFPSLSKLDGIQKKLSYAYLVSGTEYTQKWDILYVGYVQMKHIIISNLQASSSYLVENAIIQNRQGRMCQKLEKSQFRCPCQVKPWICRLPICFTSYACLLSR